MLTRREVEGELRSLGFRASARQRRAERERARRFARGVLGALFGMTLLALLSAANLLRPTRADLAFGNSNARSSEWVTNNAGPASYRSLFFTGRRTQQPNLPRRNRRRAADD